MDFGCFGFENLDLYKSWILFGSGAFVKTQKTKKFRLPAQKVENPVMLTRQIRCKMTTLS